MINYRIKINNITLVFILILFLIFVNSFLILASNVENYETNFIEKIVNLNDGYYCKFKFKKIFDENGEFIHEYEELNVKEIIVLNKYENKAPIIIRASWFNLEYMTLDYYVQNIVFSIIDMKDKIYVRRSFEYNDETYYSLYDLEGKQVLYYKLNVCTLIDTNREILLTANDVFGTVFYDKDINIIKEYKESYSDYKYYDINGKKYVLLGNKNKNNKFDKGSRLLDEELNDIYDNLSGEIYTIIDDYQYQGLWSSWKYSYNHLIINKATKNIKFKNGKNENETIIVDEKFNILFSTYGNISEAREYILSEKNRKLILLIIENKYFLFDQNIKLIETGYTNDEKYLIKKEMYYKHITSFNLLNLSNYMVLSY